MPHLINKHLWQACLSFIVVLSGCGSDGIDGNSSSSATAPMTITGSVGDGPVVNATVSFVDNNGQLVGEVSSDSYANYSFEIPQGTMLPVTIKANGGTDLVTGQELDFEMVSIITGLEHTTVNISPLTTLEAKVAECLDGPNAISTAKSIVSEKAGMGLAGSDSQYDPINADNVAAFVKANEALGEVVRRVASTIADVDENEVIRRIGCDLADGNIDGSGNSDSHTAALVHSTMAVVMLENLNNQLKVNGSNASGRMNDAITTIEPTASKLTEQVAVDASSIQQIQESLMAVRAGLDDNRIDSLVNILTTNSLQSVAAAVRQSTEASTVQNMLSENLNTLSSEAFDAIAQAARDTSAAPKPALSLATNTPIVEVGKSVSLSWYSDNTSRCEAGGSWSGMMAPEGTFTSTPLASNSNFHLTCFGPGGVASQEISVAVTNAPPAPNAPTASLTSSAQTVIAGGSATLTWQAENTESCVALGDWAGAKAETGTETVTNLQTAQTYQLRCSGAGGDITVATSIAVTTADAPQVQLAASPQTVMDGSGTQLTWTATNADSCTASGGWSGSKNTSGSAPSGELTQATSFTLTCSGNGGQSSATTNVTVQQTPPTPEPDLELQLLSNDSWIERSGSTSLEWSTSGATNCEASGAWSGPKALNGVQSTGALTDDASYALTCDGGTDSSVAIVAVSIRQAKFSWEVPTQNSDGSSLLDLAGYKIHWGDSSGNYSSSVDIDDPQQTSHVIELAPGSYFFNMTSINSAGVASPYAGELSKIIQ